MRKAIEKTESEISDLETELSVTGSTKTVADVQEELNDVSAQMSVYTFLLLSFTVLTLYPLQSGS